MSLTWEQSRIRREALATAAAATRFAAETTFHAITPSVEGGRRMQQLAGAILHHARFVEGDRDLIEAVMGDRSPEASERALAQVLPLAIAGHRLAAHAHLTKPDENRRLVMRNDLRTVLADKRSGPVGPDAEPILWPVLDYWLRQITARGLPWSRKFGNDHRLARWMSAHFEFAMSLLGCVQLFPTHQLDDTLAFAFRNLLADGYHRVIPGAPQLFGAVLLVPHSLAATARSEAEIRPVVEEFALEPTRKWLNHHAREQWVEAHVEGITELYRHLRQMTARLHGTRLTPARSIKEWCEVKIMALEWVWRHGGGNELNPALIARQVHHGFSTYRRALGTGGGLTLPAEEQMQARQAISHLARLADRAERSARSRERRDIAAVVPLLPGGRPDPVIPFAARFNQLLRDGGFTSQKHLIEKLMKEMGVSRATAFARLQRAREKNLVPPAIPKPRELTNQMQRIDPARDVDRRSA